MSHHNHHQHHPPTHHYHHHQQNATTATTLPRTLAKSSANAALQQQHHMNRNGGAAPSQPPQYQDPPQPYIDHVYAKKAALPRGPYLQYKQFQYGADCGGGPLQKSTSAVHLAAPYQQQQHNFHHHHAVNGAARPENIDNNNPHPIVRSTAQRPQSYHQSGVPLATHHQYHPQTAHPQQRLNGWTDNGVQTLGRHRHGRTAYLQSSADNLLQLRSTPTMSAHPNVVLSQGVAARSGVLTVRRPAPIGAAATSSSSSSSAASTASSSTASTTSDGSPATVQQHQPSQQLPSNFLHQIQTKNAVMAAANRTNYSNRTSSATATVTVGTSSATTASAGCGASVSYVRLDEVVHAKPAGLTAADGWAVLCQSVQSLQDLFLAGKCVCAPSLCDYFSCWVKRGWADL